MRLPIQSVGIGRSVSYGIQVGIGGINPAALLRPFGGLAAKCESDDGDVCNCPGKCCQAGTDYCTCGPCVPPDEFSIATGLTRAVSRIR